MNIELFAFSKRKNSTKVPASTGTVVTCVLKEETSQLSPAFELDTDPTTFNYVKWGNWYYYISDCTYQTNHKWRIDCVADCLATYRSAIHGTSAFIEYADSYDARIYDPRLAKKINATEIKTDGTIDVSDLTGYFVITSIGDNGSGTFLFKGNDWGSLSLLVNDLSSWYTQFIGGLPPNPTVQDVLTTLAELLVSGNVAENLKSVKWIPLPFNAKYNHTLHLGLYNTQVQCEKVSPPTITGTQLIELDIPHPSNVMLRSSNTCEYSLYLPFVGNVSLSADLLADESKLYIQPSWAVTTGELVYEVFIGSLSKIIGPKVAKFLVG